MKIWKVFTEFRKKLVEKKKKSGLKNSPGSGFSFVETLAVLAVTAILAGQVGSAGYSLVQKAKVISARTQIESIRVALQDFYIDEGRFPDSEEGLLVLWEKQNSCARWHGPYVQKPVPKDPWGNSYVYFSKDDIPEDAPEGLPFAVVCYGADGKKGGDGYEGDIRSFDEES